ncbi:hypothetical protein SLS62_009307, partial [Diatrype stigma]
PGPAPGIRLYSPGGQATTIDDRNAARKPAVERAYELSWADDVSSSKVTRTRLDSAEEMRAGIQESSLEIGTGHHRLLVLHGLPTDLLEVLRDLLDIDSDFIDAHARRQSYRPLGRRRRHRRTDAGEEADADANADANVGWAHFDYPELVDCGPDLMMRYVSQADDLLGDPVAYRLSKYGETAAMFCRGSLWTSSKLNVLLLDRPLWENPSSGIYKARYSSRVTKSAPGSKNRWGMELAAGDDIPSLETLLINHLGGPQPASANDRMQQLLEHFALRQWSEFFEALALAPPPPSSEDDLAVLYWQTHQSLERNLESSMLGGQQKATHLPTTDWERLLARLERQTRISSQLAPPPIAKIELPPQVVDRGRLARGYDGATDDDDYTQQQQQQQQQQHGMHSPEENQRSLDRVTYLGGVLLPISVVSGILSMNDDFSPGGDMFYVFWAVTMPLCLVTLLVIYADSIRKVEVWIEDTATGASPPPPGENEAHRSSRSSSSSNSDGGGGGTGALPPNPYALGLDLEEAGLASAAVAMPVSMASRRRTMMQQQQQQWQRQQRGDECTGMPPAPGIIAEHSFSSSSAAKSGSGPGSGLGQQPKRWKKQQLGWMGACKSIFRIYKLKQLQSQEPGPGPGPGPGLRPPAARRRATRSI